MLKGSPYPFVLLLFFFCKSAQATHIVGGEIYYDNLGGNTYKIHMKVYRDCINGVPPFDGWPDKTGRVLSAVFTVFDAQGNAVRTGTFTPLTYTTLPPTNNNVCAPDVSATACVQQAIYETTLQLPPKMGGYYIVYQRCCRNATILNLIDPGSVGTTYWEHIPGPEVVLVNSSPRFASLPPIYICNNNPIEYNHVATDPDGDSLVYSLCTPFNGLDKDCPILGDSSCPLPNEAPPYVSVPFSPPYSASYPLSSHPAININSATGFLNGTPTILGQWVVGVCVSEYRRGVLIGTHHRDFQFNVIPCPFVVTADIISQTTTNNGQGTGYCNGFTISYQNNSSSNASSYFWDFGDPGSTTDTSSAYNPTYTYTLVGTYTATLIVNPGSRCSDTTTEVFQVRPLLSPDFLLPQAQCFRGNHYDFALGGSFQGNGTFNWDFGANAIPPTANTPTVSNVRYHTPGIYNATIVVNENDCSAWATKVVEVVQNPQALIGPYTTIGCHPLSVTFPNQSTAASDMVFNWVFSDGTTSTEQSPTHIFTQPGVYSVSLTVTANQKCVDTSQVSAVNSIIVKPTPLAAFNYVSGSGVCFNNHQLDFVSTSRFTGASGVLAWHFGVGASPQTATTQSVNHVVYNAPGTYTVSLTASENGCSNTSTQLINLYQNPLAAIAPFNAKGCDPFTVSFNNTSTAASDMVFNWVFSDGTRSNERHPQHLFTPAGIYNYTLTVITTQKCIDTSQYVSISSITVNPTPIANFTATPLVTSIFDPDITFFNLSGEGAFSWHYDFGDGSSTSDENPLHTYATWGNYTVFQTLTNRYACSNTATLSITILPEFRFWVPNAFTPGKQDHLNDVFKPVVVGVEEYTWMIFNRWGDLIYKTNDPEAGWNGTFKGADSPLDVYVWKCEFKNVVSNLKESHVGHVTLLR